jgi:hypothetical protein
MAHTFDLLAMFEPFRPGQLNPAQSPLRVKGHKEFSLIGAVLEAQGIVSSYRKGLE